MGITKGATMQRILGAMAEMSGKETTAFDMVLCIGALERVGDFELLCIRMI